MTPSQTDSIYQEPFPTSIGIFAGLDAATDSGARSVSGKAGILWGYAAVPGAATNMSLCANGNTPINLTWDLGEQGNVSMIFNSFTPGVPAASNFIQPTAEPASFGLLGLVLACGVMVQRKVRSGNRIRLAARQ